MGHLDDDNLDRYTIRIWHKIGDGGAEVFNSATNVDADSESRIEFDDRNGKHQIFQGVDYHVAAE